MYQFTITNDTVTVFVKGEPISVTKGSPNYDALRRAVINEDWDEVPKHLTVAQAVENWATKASEPTPVVYPDMAQVVAAGAERMVKNAPLSSGSRDIEPSKAPAASTPALAAPTPQGEVKVVGDTVTYNGEPLPKKLNDRILKAVATGESATGLMNFWKRLKRNPNKRSIEQLWDFLLHCGIPVQPDGTFLAYKGVRYDFRDQHSGQFDNSPGKTVKMDRAKISTDPSRTCHTGLHVGALSYARGFAAQTLIVRVDPEHVCCVPNDYGFSKMRVCEYTVMGIYGAQMPDVVYDAAEETAVVTPEAAPVVETEDRDEAPEVEEQTLPITGTPWDDFNEMDAAGLTSQSLDDLRKYARYNCLITGASKLPGGKETLIAKIVETRNRGTVPEPAPEPEVEEILVTPEAITEVEETKPLALSEQPAVKVPLTGTQWDHLNQMDSLTLMEQSLDDLRKYATYNCLMVGASKVPGGKFALVTRICDIRGDNK